MDIILLLVFSYLIHQRAKLAGEIPFRWVLRFAMVWLLISTLCTFLMGQIWDLDFSRFSLADPQLLVPMVITGLVSVGLSTIAFLLIYRHLSRLAEENEESEDGQEPEKDLSYFR
jgi:hypothetical protein